MYLENINNEKQEFENKDELDEDFLKALDEMDKEEARKVKTGEIKPVPEPRKEVAIANRSFADRFFEAIDSNDFIAFNKTTMKVLRKLKLTGSDWNLITYLFEMTVGYNFTMKKPQGKKIRRSVKKKNKNWIYPKAIKDNTGIDRTNLYRNLNKLKKMKTITIHQKATKTRPYLIEFNIRWDRWNINKEIIRYGLSELEKISERAKK
jgi:hypothetical protein